MKKILYSMICLVFLSTFIFASQNGNLDKQGNNGQSLNISGKINYSALSGMNYTLSNGKKFQIVGGDANYTKMKIENFNLTSSLDIYVEEDSEGEGFKFGVGLSNGYRTGVLLMPDKVSEIAIRKLELNHCDESEGCTIELKEVGRNNDTRVAYEVKAQKEARVLGLFKTKMQVNAKVDAETGEVIQSNKPWWAFLASE